MNQVEFERLQAEREKRYADAQEQAQVEINKYQQGSWQDIAASGLAANIASTGYAQQPPTDIAIENERAFRAQALSLAIDFHKHHGNGSGVEATAEKFLAFLKGAVNV